MDDIKNYVEVFRNRSLNLLVCTSISIVLGIIYLNVTTPMFTAYMKIGPVDTSEQSSSSSGLGAAAGLVGINLGNSNTSSNYLIFQETIKTTRLAERLIAKDDPRKVFFSSTYDKEKDRFS